MITKNIAWKGQFDIHAIRDFQKEHQIVIPSDYVYIIEQFDGLYIDEPVNYEVLNAENIAIVQFENIISLQHLSSEFPLIKEIEEEDDIDILGRYCPFAATSSKILLLIGNHPSNVNEIFLWNYEFYNDESSPERLHKVADNYIDLINNRLIADG